MGTLRSELQALVEVPPAPAPSIEEVAVSAGRLRRNRAWMASGMTALVLAGAVLGLNWMPNRPRPTEVVVGGGGPAAAGYIARNPGGYEASGEWRLTIERGDQIIDLRSGGAPRCRPVGFIRPGDEVRGSVSGEGSTLKAGEDAGC